MKWNLNESNFTFKDRLKICSFFLNPKKFWTMADEVIKFERKMANYVGVKHAVFVSNGSTANTIVAMYLKDQFKGSKKNIMVFPSTTWITSVSPFIREGFEPHFIDVNPQNLSIDLESLEKYLKRNGKKIACVFITSLLGFSPDVDTIERLRKKYGVKIMLDNCESTFTNHKSRNISSYYTSTTSTYFGHHLQSVEGGFLFTNSDYEYEYFLMARNHGMTRSLTQNKEHYLNDDVDSRFDFNLLGNNFRNTNINAFIGQLDFKRVEKYADTRKKMYDLFYEGLAWKNASSVKRKDGDVPFSIPLIFQTKERCEQFKVSCQVNGIETRPIISGNLLRQKCLIGYGDPLQYPNSEILHHNGVYVGLHAKIAEEHIRLLLSIL